MPLEAVAYTSSASYAVTPEALEMLLVKARRTNAELGITGVLLFHDGSFFQYFEGPAGAVDEAYARIRRSPLHDGIIELMRGPIEARSFAGWLMGCTQAPGSTLLMLSNASWEEQVRRTPMRTPAAPVLSEGMELLLQFWDTNRGPVYR